MLTLSKTPNSGSYNSFYVIDGQQRLTTLLILINELLKKVTDGIVGVGDKAELVKKYLYEKPFGEIQYRYRFSYCNDDPSDEYFKTMILEKNSTGSKLVPQSTLYTNNLKAAKDFFAEKQQGKNDIKVDWKIFEENHKNKVSIEHIYPQTDTDEYWQTRFTNEEHRALRHSLGNLLLLSQSKNSEAQNDSYVAKKALYQHGSHSEIDVVTNYGEWTPTAVINRGMALLGFIEKHWSISFSDTQKQKLLKVSNELWRGEKGEND